MTIDYDNDLLVVTSASGKQGADLLPFLYGKWKKLRLVVKSEKSQQNLKGKYPDAEVVRADLSNPDNVKPLLSGATAIHHIGPSFHPHETEIGKYVIDAASEESKRGTFKHFVYSSVLNTQLQKLLNHDCKRYVEEYLMESGLNYTILNPGHFMQPFMVRMILDQDKPIFHAGFNPNVPFSFCALPDLGEAAANVLDGREKHYFAQYPLVSTMPTTYKTIITMFAGKLGKEILIEHAPLEEATDRLLKVLVGDGLVDQRMRDVALRMLLFYNYHGLLGNPGVMEWLLGRKPTSIDEWLTGAIAAAKGDEMET